MLFFCFHRHFGPDCGAIAGSGFDIKSTAYQADALAHADQSQASIHHYFFYIEAEAEVLDCKFHGSSFGLQLDKKFFHAAMLDGVMQPFLKNAI